MRKLISLAMLAIVLIAPSCATILSGSQMNVNVPGGNVQGQVYYNGRYIGETPTKVRVQKKTINGLLEIKAEGYETEKIPMYRAVSAGWMVVGLLTFPALLVDFASGAIYKQRPKEVRYNLEKSK